MALMFEPPDGNDKAQSEHFNRKACVAAGPSPLGWEKAVARAACELSCRKRRNHWRTIGDYDCVFILR